MYLLYKNPLETCLEAVTRLKEQLKTSKQSSARKGDFHSGKPQKQGKNINDSFTYAGRLDPLARGVLVVLSGAEIEKKMQFLDLPKTYEFEVVFGVSTDTFDQLGVVRSSDNWKTLKFDSSKVDESVLGAQISKAMSVAENNHIHTEKLNWLLKPLIGNVNLHYPFYSSQPVEGKPLFQFTKENGIEKANELLPSKNVELFNIECIGFGSVTTEDLKSESIYFAEQMKGEFRQKEITDSWKEWKTVAINELAHPDLKILKLRVTCSSGFYIRSFACWLGQIAGRGALARDINRIKVGKYSLEENKEINLIKID